MDLTVVGAGPAGLATALAARRRGLRVRVYEQGQPDDPRPGTWVLSRNGLEVLDRLGRFTLRPIDRARVEDPDGRILAEIPLRSAAVVLRKTLLEELRALCVAEGVELVWGQRASEGVLASGTQPGKLFRRRYVRGLCAGPPPRPYPLEIWYSDGSRAGFEPTPDGRTGFYYTGRAPVLEEVLESEEKMCGPTFPRGGTRVGDAFAAQAPTLSQGCSSALVDGWRVGHGFGPAPRLRTQILSWALSEAAARPFPGRNALVAWLARRPLLQRWLRFYLEGEATLRDRNFRNFSVLEDRL